MTRRGVLLISLTLECSTYGELETVSYSCKITMPSSYSTPKLWKILSSQEFADGLSKLLNFTMEEP